MRSVLTTILATTLAACVAPQEGCGLIGCITSPHLRARGSHDLVGVSVANLISVMREAPTSSADIGNNQRVMTWARSQNDRDFGFLSCTETFTTRGDSVVSYDRRGNCGGQR